MLQNWSVETLLRAFSFLLHSVADAQLVWNSPVVSMMALSDILQFFKTKQPF